VYKESFFPQPIVYWSFALSPFTFGRSLKGKRENLNFVKTTNPRKRWKLKMLYSEKAHKKASKSFCSKNLFLSF
jgi:hypothetical protein